VPRAHLLSNGRYRVILTDRGGGSSAWQDVALTRWAADRSRDVGGVTFYLRDLARGPRWSAGWTPIAGKPDRYETVREASSVAFVREEYEVESRMDVVVDPESDVEYRVLALANRGPTERRLDVTTYLEVTLNDPAADAAHPAFSKLFVETEYQADTQALLARRRPRGPDDPPLWMGHGFWLEGGAPGDLEVETDRARFIGRGRTLADPAALDAGTRLSGSVGPVLDPVFSLRRGVRLPPGGTARLVALVAAAERREDLARRLTATQASRADAILRSAQRDELPGDPQTLADLTGALLFGVAPAVTPSPLPEPSPLTRADLSALGVAANAPLVLALLRTDADCARLRSLGPAVRWWRECGLAVTLLVLEDGASAEGVIDRDPATIVRSVGDVAPELLILAQRCARLTLDWFRDTAPAQPVVSKAPILDSRAAATPVARDELLAFNGYGGFTADGSEYVIRLDPVAGRLRLPPRPWTNVVANETAGFVASETGAGYTWTVNSRENRLTPWSNDPVLDPPGETLYLRDEDRDLCWSPTPGPLPDGGAYECRHGFGYSAWRHTSLDLEQETTAFVPRRDAVKLVRVRVTNRGPAARRLSLSYFARWVLGTTPEQDGRLLVTQHDLATGAILAVNPYRGPLAGRVAFACVVGPEARGAAASHTGDRAAFLAAECSGAPLDGRTGAGLDPCAAFRVPFTLPPGTTAEWCVLLGEADTRAAALQLCRRYRSATTVSDALDEVRRFWRDTLGRLQGTTPVPAIDLVVNGWLAYQNLSCRMWGRSAFYQSGGAYGFRDQLQDSSALVWLSPETTRAQILLHAAHQFPEGDVLHWWHPPDSRGIRTRFADDPLWLPYVTSEYVRHTGDEGVLGEAVGFLEARTLAAGEDYAFLFPRDSGADADLYEHCCRAVDRSLTRGAHGLPLIAGGDWNDGMNRVGRLGRGESVWLGFFLYDVLQRVLPWCERRRDMARIERYRNALPSLGAALNDGGWDGAWYRRAYYDDGVPIGSAQSDECRIDAIAQAWAVLSGAAPPDRAARALDALEDHLVDAPAGLIRLLTPPFDRTSHDPGYIKGYVAGVRENGGQYTHGVLWAVRALAELGRGERAAALLELLSPVTRAREPGAVAVYQAEPYVVAADVYGAAPHVGRAGWTWYTGSAGWMYRVAVESVLGLTVNHGATLLLRPCIPASWPGYSLRYRVPGTETQYAITVAQPRPRPARTVATLDGAPLEVAAGAVTIPLLTDGVEHRVDVRLGKDVGPRYHARPAASDRAD
jgi:cyclic beta-1,2-glucan synthetase